MNKRPTRKDVAALAKVSVATVSYVVNGGPRPVAAETRERVLNAVEQLGYRPHAIARSLKTGNTHTVALLAQSLIEPFTGYFVNAIERCLDKHGYELILASSHEDREREKRLLDVLAARSIDGLLYIPVSNKDPEPVLAIIDEGIPVIFVDRYIPGVPADVVMSDNVAATRQLTDYTENAVRDVAFSPDGTTLVFAADHHGNEQQPDATRYHRAGLPAALDEAAAVHVHGVTLWRRSSRANSTATLLGLGVPAAACIRGAAKPTRRSSAWATGV